MAENNSSKQDFYFIDTHAHLDMLKKITPDFAVKESLRENVKFIINVGSSLEGSKKSLEYSRLYSNVFASVGVHPHDADDFKNEDAAALELLIRDDVISDNNDTSNNNCTDVNGNISINNRNKKVVAIGETGFDYFRNLSLKKDQEKAFISQIELALKYNLPLIIHDRDAHEDTLKILDRYSSDKNKNFKAVVHCFSGNTDFALKCLELGLFISFTGVITFPNAKSLAATVKEVPIDRIFIETDSPFLAPQEKRGQENYPGFVKYVAYKIAELKNMSVAEVAAITSKTAESFFSLV
jgi:TatD DNase family protein